MGICDARMPHLSCCRGRQKERLPFLELVRLGPHARRSPWSLCPPSLVPMPAVRLGPYARRSPWSTCDVPVPPIRRPFPLKILPQVQPCPFKFPRATLWVRPHRQPCKYHTCCISREHPPSFHMTRKPRFSHRLRNTRVLW